MCRIIITKKIFHLFLHHIVNANRYFIYREFYDNNVREVVQMKQMNIKTKTKTKTKTRIRMRVAGIAILIIVMGLCGCGSSKKSGTSDTKDTGKILDTYRYTPLQLDNINDSTNVYASCFYNDTLYYLSVNLEELENAASEGEKAEWTDTGEVWQYNCNTGECAGLFSVKNASEASAMNVDDTGLVSIISGETLTKYSSDGDELLEKSLSGEINDKCDTELDIGLCRFERDGALYIAGMGSNTEIYKFDSEGNCVGVVKSEDFVDDFLIDNEGNFASVSGSGSGLKITGYDFESGKKNETITIENQKDQYCFGNGDVHGGSLVKCAYDGYGDVSFFLRDSTGLYSYKKGSGEIELVFEWLGTGMIGEYVKSIEQLSDGRMFCICYDSILNFEAGFVKKTDNSEEKTVIRCAALYPEGDYAHDLQKCVIDFNRKSDDIYVELVSYEKSESPMSQFAKDIVTGNIPDVIDISSVNVDNYISKGLFEDLVPYMEKDDVLSKDYFVEGLLDAVAVDGKQFFAFKGFRLITLAGKASDLTQYSEGWNITDMIDYYCRKSEGRHLYMYDSKEDVFDNFIAGNVQDYIDWETGSVHFDSHEFKKMLSFSKMFPDDMDFGIDYNEVKNNISEGSILLNIVRLDGWNYDAKLNDCLFDGDTRYIGFPSSDGKLAYIEPVKGSLAITSTSEHKEEAWEFLKSVITKDDFTDMALPAGKKDFERMAKRMTATEVYTDEDGKVVEPLDDIANYNGLEVVIKPYSEEDIRNIKKLIANSKMVTDNHEIADIIKNELFDYYAGRKSIDEIIGVIQDKVGKYVNENK